MPLVWVALVGLALAAVVITTAVRWPMAATSRRRAVLLVLRLLVAAAILLLLMRPVFRWQGDQQVSGEVAFLLDASRSMGVRDAALAPGGPVSRTEAVRAAFLSVRDPYTELAQRCLISPYAFGSHTRSTDQFGPDPVDPRTDLGEALGSLAARPSGRLEAVVMISDGRANRARGPPEEAARRLAERGAKVHTLVVGSVKPTEHVRDVAVRDLRAPARIFVRNRPEIRATVATLGLAGTTIDVVLSLSGKEVERRRVTAASSRTAEEVVFTPKIDAPGLVVVALAVAPLEGELTETNNRAETTVRVEEGGIPVLYLDGRIHPEGKYVARTLGEASEIALDRRILIGGAAGSGSPSAADLEAFDVLILGDLPASALPAATVARMAERVREGNFGVLMLGGLSALGAGGWAATPLASVLPVAIRADDGQVQGPIRFRPTPEAAGHYIFSAESGGAVNFDALAPLAGANVVGPLDPTARLLAASPEGRPLLAVREFARSRVAVLTVDTTWQWVLAPGGKAAGGPGSLSGAEIHRRFWRQLILWLAGRDSRPQADLWVMTDRPRYRVADPDEPPSAEVTVHVRGGSEVSPSVELTGPDGAVRQVPLAPAAGAQAGRGAADWRAELPLTDAGRYSLAAQASVGGAAKRAEAQFTVEQQDFEMADVLADPDALARIARAGSGTFRPVAQLKDLLAELAEGLPARFEPADQRFPLASERAFLAVVLALLAAEWFLRRRWGAA